MLGLWGSLLWVLEGNGVVLSLFGMEGMVISAFCFIRCSTIRSFSFSLSLLRRFQSLDILPLPQYGAFRQYLKDNATSLCQLLEPVVSVKSKEDIATTLINIMQKEERAITFLVSLILTDIQRIGEKKSVDLFVCFRRLAACVILISWLYCVITACYMCCY